MVLSRYMKQCDSDNLNPNHTITQADTIHYEWPDVHTNNTHPGLPTTALIESTLKHYTYLDTLTEAPTTGGK